HDPPDQPPGGHGVAGPGPAVGRPAGHLHRDRSGRGGQEELDGALAGRAGEPELLLGRAPEPPVEHGGDRLGGVVADQHPVLDALDDLGLEVQAGGGAGGRRVGRGGGRGGLGGGGGGGLGGGRGGGGGGGGGWSGGWGGARPLRRRGGGRGPAAGRRPHRRWWRAR